MLAELHIRDFAIIDELQLHFAPGFSALTGETGAGKSIIVDAVELVLGGRADATSVRAGADRAIIEAVFRLEPGQRTAIDLVLEREGLEGDDPDLLLLGREVRLSGRNVCRVNGRAVTLALLRQVAEGLVDIHGQSEHLSLLRVREHVNLLDRYAELWPLRVQVAELAGRVREIRRELADLVLREQELAHRADLLQFQIGEIGAAALQFGEEKELLKERLRLTHAEQLTALVSEALCTLEEGEGQAVAALDLLGAAQRALEGLARVDPALEPRLRAAESLNYQVEELVGGLRDYQEQIEHNPQRLQEVEERLTLIRRLERKYGTTIPDVLTYAEKAAQELDTITHSEERVAELQADEERLLAELGELAAELSLRRREAAERLAAGIEDELGDLRMEGARFGVDFRLREDPEGVPVDEWRMANGEWRMANGELLSAISNLQSARVAFDSSGIDRVEFLVSPNPGEPLKPLVKIASGGETSRLMLALKTVLSRADETPTLIFDEIDQGIGGRVGATVGEKLWGLTVGTRPGGGLAAGRGPGGLRHQVLCVTHLPQLAGFGDVHFRVEKHVEKTGAGERTVARVRQLQGGARVEELAQMLGASGEAAYRSAEEILEQVASRKLQRVVNIEPET
ncbi:MAG: DNA repair protein RecN [Chloroflexi bacterium]|nr:DNA repair protein RecN [Chloroflexota bacterium]